MSQKYPDIEYGAHDLYEIKNEKIRNLVDNTPDDNIIDIATYYLKNLILPVGVMLYEFLNEVGEEGWEVVGMAETRGGIELVLKRSKVVAEPEG